MAISTQRRVYVSLGKDFGVNAIQSLGVILKMALLANLILVHFVLSDTGDLCTKVRITHDIGVAVGAKQLIAMH